MKSETIMKREHPIMDFWFEARRIKMSSKIFHLLYRHDDGLSLWQTFAKKETSRQQIKAISCSNSEMMIRSHPTEPRALPLGRDEMWK